MMLFRVNFLGASVAAIFLSACTTGAPKSAEVPDSHGIGFNAVLVSVNTVKAEKLIEAGKLNEAVSFLDSTQLYQLSLIRTFDADVVKDERFRRLRDRLVTDLQDRWLRQPPRFLDDASAEYLERTCVTIPGCTQGRVKPREPIPDVPPD
jgi:hypothetical protein